MPTYDYECEACGGRFERRQAITEEPITECPDCGGKVHRLVSGGAGFIMKGSGHHGRSHGDGAECSLERTGRTCCGRDDRCGKAPCTDGK